MKSQARNTKDPRIQEILNLIYELASGNLVARGTLSENDDYLDGIITGINMLADEIAQDITKREQVEEELKRSKEFSETVMNGITDAVSVINVDDFTIAGVNTAFLQTYNYKEEEIIGKTCYEITHHRSVPCTAPDDVCPLDDVITSGQPAVVEHLHHGKDGKKSNVEVSAFPIIDEGGRTTQIIHVVKDITERKQTEEALEISESKFSRAFHSNPHPMSIVTLAEGRYLDVNDSYVRTFGFSRQELLGRTTVEMGILKDDRARRKILQSLKTEQTIKNLEVEFHTRSGRKVDVLLSADKTEIGGQTCLLSVLTDITERKRIEEALQAAEQNFRNSLDECPLGIRIVDEEGKAVYANQAILDIYGYDSLEELNAVTVRGRYTKESYAEHLLRKARRKRGQPLPESYEVSIVCKDGQVRHLEASHSDVIWDGKPQLQVFYQDITERKRAEEKRKQLIQELQETLKEVRTLSGLLPICAWCKKLRDDEGYWKSVEQYIGERTKAEFTHGVCPECQSKFFRERNSNTKVS